MKTLALSLALLAAAGPALAAGDLNDDAPRLEANMAEKKQLRAVQGRQEAPAAGAAFNAQAGDNPSPALLAKIQLATQAYQTWDGVTKEAKIARVVKAPESAQAIEGNGRVKQVGALKVDKMLDVDLNRANSPRPPAAIGKAIGNHANDGDEER